MAAHEGDVPMEEIAVREQDKYLPIANISRIMKEALPHNAKVSKDAKELVQNCVSDFIIYITSQASDKCQREKRKTVNGDDLLWAMQSLGFDDSVVVLTTYLQKIREAEGEDKSAKGAAPGASKDGSAAGPAPNAVPEHAPQAVSPTPGQQMAYVPVQVPAGHPLMEHMQMQGGQPEGGYESGQQLMMQVPVQPGQGSPQPMQQQQQQQQYQHQHYGQQGPPHR